MSTNGIAARDPHVPMSSTSAAGPVGPDGAAGDDDSPDELRAAGLDPPVAASTAGRDAFYRMVAGFSYHVLGRPLRPYQKEVPPSRSCAPKASPSRAGRSSRASATAR